jgi:hypothetical protein
VPSIGFDEAKLIETRQVEDGKRVSSVWCVTTGQYRVPLYAASQRDSPLRGLEAECCARMALWIGRAAFQRVLRLAEQRARAMSGRAQIDAGGVRTAD